jgi:hypothetical protein
LVTKGASFKPLPALMPSPLIKTNQISFLKDVNLEQKSTGKSRYTNQF